MVLLALALLERGRGDQAAGRSVLPRWRSPLVILVKFFLEEKGNMTTAPFLIWSHSYYLLGQVGHIGQWFHREALLLVGLDMLVGGRLSRSCCARFCAQGPSDVALDRAPICAVVVGLNWLLRCPGDRPRGIPAQSCNQQAWSSILHAGIRSRAYFTDRSCGPAPTSAPTLAPFSFSRTSAK